MKRHVKIALLGCLISFTASPAYAAYYGAYYGRPHGTHYGHSYGHYRPYYRHAYRYRGGHHGYYHGGYYHGSRYRRHGHHGYHGGLIHGLVSIPAAILGAVLGHGHAAYSRNDGAYDRTAEVSTTPRGSGAVATAAPATRAYENNSSAPRARQAPAGPPAGPGWVRLAGGHYATALSIFAGEARSQPAKAAPKVGYALSAAAGGNLQRGAWAMRRAFTADSGELRSFNLNESVRPRVEQLLARYQAAADSRARDRDAAFMLSSLHYLLGDEDSALDAIEVAVQRGDDDASTRNLRRLIDAERLG